ncbi:MAG: hypothetical protein AAF645_30520 [Myxococcota bacterium]
MTRALVLLLVACGSPRPPTVCEPSPPAHEVAAFDAAALWSEFEETLRVGYAYLERADFDVDAQIAHARERALAAPDFETFRRGLHRFAMAFSDPHFYVGPLEDGDPNVWPTSGDLFVALDDEGFFVSDVRRDSPADGAGVRPGWRFLGTAQGSVDEAIAALWEGAVLAGTPKQRAYAATLVANGRRGDGERALRFSFGAQSHALTLASPRAFASAVEERPVVQLQYEGDVPVVRFENRLGDHGTIEAFGAIAAQIEAAPCVIVDLRNTPSGGNSDVACGVLGHFVDQPTPYQVHTFPYVERKHGVLRRAVQEVIARAPRVRGRVAVLGGHWTGSMGEGLVIGLHAAGARTFASDMGDLLGGMANFEIGALRVDFGVEALFHVNGTPREDYVADVALPSADRNPDGEDPALQAALAWCQG